MYTLAVIIHLIACFIMIGAILLQSGKGAEIGAAFGGSSQTVFGSRGPGTFLSKITVGAAVVFMATSLSLAILSKERIFSSTIIDLNKAASPPAAPTTPAESQKAGPSQKPGETKAADPAPAGATSVPASPATK